MTNPYQAQPISGPYELQNLANTISLLAPGVQNVTLVSQNTGANQGTYTSYNVARARRRMLTVQERITNHALLTERTLIWEFWDEFLQQAGAPNPKPGDQISDVFGTKYIIVGMEKVAQNLQLYSCLCQISPP